MFALQESTSDNNFPDEEQVTKTSDKKQAIKTTRNKIKIEEYLRANGFAKASDIASNLHLSQARIRVILSQMDNVIVEGANRNRLYRLKE